ncbi:MAG: hypothetical protein HY578_03475 [Nitrospinae bacterium]|nr:hypothetical protein [Nitrospinota bacterium]
MSNKEYQRFLDKCLRIEEDISKVFIEIDRHDLHLIVRNLLMPKKWGKRFLLKRRGNRYVP